MESNKEYKIEYISKGSYGYVFKVINKDKKTAIKIQTLDEERTFIILMEMAILMQIQRVNERFKNDIRYFNPFVCDLEKCMLVKNTNYVNKTICEYLQVIYFI